MRSEQVFTAAEEMVANLLGLKWCRVSNKDTGWVPNAMVNRREIQNFQFYKADGSVACTVEFEHYEIYEGPMLGSIYGRKGKILDSKGGVIIEEGNLTDTYAKSHRHPLNDLYDICWGKESGEPVSQEGKFPETIKLEKFTEGLKV